MWMSAVWDKLSCQLVLTVGEQFYRSGLDLFILGSSYPGTLVKFWLR